MMKKDLQSVEMNDSIMIFTSTLNILEVCLSVC